LKRIDDPSWAARRRSAHDAGCATCGLALLGLLNCRRIGGATCGLAPLGLLNCRRIGGATCGLAPLGLLNRRRIGGATCGLAPLGLLNRRRIVDLNPRRLYLLLQLSMVEQSLAHVHEREVLNIAVIPVDTPQ
jgi:hypothetical protein